VALALSAPHDNAEAIFPAHLRPPSGAGLTAQEPGKTNWRFRVPENEYISFQDGRAGNCCFITGQDFGDFLVWRKDGFPSYELAVVVDDAGMHITEVVRGQDLLLSTARQILLYKALALDVPEFYHLELVLDEKGERLAKRDGSFRISAYLAEHGRDALAEFLISGRLTA
jgi:glutamyl-tRNA synthetase